MEKKTILLVDDEEDTLTEVVSCFSDKFSVQTANSLSSAKQAIENYSKNNNDNFYCIIIDLKVDNQSEFSGVKLIKYLQENKPDMPYLVFSAYSPLDVAREAFQKTLGLKDFDLEKLTKERYVPKSEGNYIRVLAQKLQEIGE